VKLPEELAAPIEALAARRPDARLDLRWQATVPSTMDAAAALAASGAAHGVVVAADEQTSGRGRRGSSWRSPPGAGVYLSFLARPAPSSLALLPLLTLAAGVGVRAGVQKATGLEADLKWPNDVLVGRRKLAGILAEGHAIGTAQQAVVIGVGVNVRDAAYPADLSSRATSLEGELGHAVDRGAVIAEVLLGLWDALALLERAAGDILQAWRAASPSASGTRVEGEGLAGTTAGIDETGALLVRTPRGIERVISGHLDWQLTT
jgi:BirA family biotin operon repressor/biotin-[acetyl-CoA-carboxylase] ligase